MPIAHNRALVHRNIALARASSIVPYLTLEEVAGLESAASRNRKGDRDHLLISLLFQTGMRISEALSLTPSHLEGFEGRPVFRFIVKGGRPHRMACPTRLADRLQAYAFRHGLGNGDRFFPINRKRGHQIVKKAAQDAGLEKRVYPHLLRHSDAIERLRRTGNPKALQQHFGWRSPHMVMRYLSTLQEEDALRIQGQVEFDY